ncbi:hypothetical protein E5Q_02728 [Mixia osmundae IAM 14324]|uniref:Glutamine synthetase n=1 Tax=Mixia osmundae (strain CBS 9802 / IAM 14324 / JCM 22182 / KY 12970) TaxID=764103 RepID=G7DZQ7_MIXOS|nr:hypothetical protein E5Q_02728 [Mixia osmundae IAM 14324]
MASNDSAGIPGDPAQTALGGVPPKESWRERPVSDKQRGFIDQLSKQAPDVDVGDTQEMSTKDASAVIDELKSAAATTTDPNAPKDQPQQPEPPGANDPESLLKNPQHWSTGDDDPTEKQKRYLAVLESKSGQQVSGGQGLNKGQASERIDQLKKQWPSSLKASVIAVIEHQDDARTDIRQPARIKRPQSHSVLPYMPFRGLSGGIERSTVRSQQSKRIQLRESDLFSGNEDRISLQQFPVIHEGVISYLARIESPQSMESLGGSVLGTESSHREEQKIMRSSRMPSPPDVKTPLSLVSPIPQLNRKPSKEAVEPPDIHHVHLRWCDLCGQAREQIVSYKRYRKQLGKDGMTKHAHVTIPKSTMGLTPDDRLSAGFGPVGEVVLIPDPSSLRALPWLNAHHAAVMCVMEEKPKGPDRPPPYSLCTRTLLAEVIEYASLQGHMFMCGFDIDFVLLSAKTDRSATIGGQGATRALTPGLVNLLDDIVDALHESGIEVDDYQTLSAPGQFRISLREEEPLIAVDSLLHAKDAIRLIAAANGYRSTFAPKVFREHDGTGQHVRITIAKTNVTGRLTDARFPNLPMADAMFAAGLLRHLPAITAFTQATPMSFERAVPGSRMGASWAAWGSDNRETPLRLCYVNYPRKYHWELRSFDATANPYIALSAIIAAGVLGIKKQLELRQFDCLEDPSLMSRDELKALGIRRPMPRSFRGALEKLTEDAVLAAAIGPSFVKAYTLVKQAQMQVLSDLSKEEAKAYMLKYY